MTNPPQAPGPTGDKPPAVRIVGASAVRVFSQPAEERLARMFRRAGAADVAPTPTPIETARVALVRGDHIYDEALAAPLLGPADFVLVTDTGRGPRAVAAAVPATAALQARALLAAERHDPAPWRALGVEPRTVDELSLAYRHALRNRVPPFILPLETMPAREIERRMFMAAYKGVTDFVTKHVWPAPALAVTRVCAAAGISPNAVTLASFLCVVAATWLFATGWFAAGLLFAWGMCFLDTVDGKLARVTLTSSKWGNVFDHGTDLVHPPFWWFAWYWGVVHAGSPGVSDATLWVSMLVVIAGYLIGRAEEGIFLWAFRIEIHVWQPLDSRFRQITARRNPNLAILSVATALGRPDWGLVAVAVWTALSLAFHAVRIVQAFAEKARSGRLSSWLSETDAPG